MKACWERWGDTGDGMPEDGFETVAADVSGLNLDDFFHASVRGTGELPLDSLLHTHGVQYHVRAASCSNDKGGQKVENSKQRRVWLGATLAETNGKSTFTNVMNGGPAELAGIAPGDEAVALDGLQLTSSNADNRLKAYRDGDEADLAVFRGDELLTSRIRLVSAPLDTCYLELVEDVELDVESRRMAWLHG
jgi:predicted metalloprotease with PDZ domain